MALSKIFIVIMFLLSHTRITHYCYFIFSSPKHAKFSPFTTDMMKLL
ncbi:hypothetical protein B4065_3350 [Caldibacillus thermoamylovorans]|nr:hypothetical protein B4065_3350 [Caldibacillus thermoamylovorans]